MKINNRPFGCEFEVSTSFQTLKKIIAPIIKKIYGKYQLYAREETFDSDTRTNKWHLKLEPSSVSEFCTPISTFKDIKRICQVIEELDKNDIKITNDDSLHVHVSIPDVDPKHIIATWLQYDYEIKRCFPKHRWDKDKEAYNDEILKYKGKKKRVADFLKDAISSSESHQSILSFSNYEERKTVEFRISEGTLDPEHVYCWIKFCLYLVNYAKTIEDPILLVCEELNQKTLYEMMDDLDIDDERVLDWLIKRRGKKRKERVRQSLKKHWIPLNRL